jgi:hypothetical protein
MPLTIGLTGGIAAGKSEALAAFSRLGAATLSSDAVVHELLDSEPLVGRLVERWGPEVAPQGKVDRTRIGEIVFADPEQLTWLEQQIHPLVGERIGGWLLDLPATTGIAVIDCQETSSVRMPPPAATPWSTSARRASSPRRRRRSGRITSSPTTARSRIWSRRCPP